MFFVLEVAKLFLKTAAENEIEVEVTVIVESGAELLSNIQLSLIAISPSFASSTDDYTNAVLLLKIQRSIVIAERLL